MVKPRTQPHKPGATTTNPINAEIKRNQSKQKTTAKPDIREKLSRCITTRRSPFYSKVKKLELTILMPFLGDSGLRVGGERTPNVM